MYVSRLIWLGSAGGSVPTVGPNEPGSSLQVGHRSGFWLEEQQLSQGAQKQTSGSAISPFASVPVVTANIPLANAGHAVKAKASYGKGGDAEPVPGGVKS